MKKITELDTVDSMESTDKVFVNVGDDIVQITKENLMRELFGIVKAKGSAINLKNTDGGNPIMVTNWTKNLLEITAESQTVNGITFTVDKTNGTITANGTATKTVMLKVCDTNHFSKNTYRLSGCATNGSDLTYMLYSVCAEGEIYDKGNGAIIQNNLTHIAIYIFIREGYTADNLVFKPMMTLGTEVKPFVPNEYDIIACGKNLVKNDVINYRFLTSDLTITPNADGSVTINGTAPTSGGYPRIKYYNTKEATFVRKLNKDYVIKATGNTDCYLMAFLFNSDYSVYKELSAATNDVLIPKDTYAEYTNVQVAVAVNNNGASFDNYVVYPQVEVGTISTPYEPYKGTVVHVTNDTVAPVYGLETFDGQTNVIAPSDVTVIAL